MYYFMHPFCSSDGVAVTGHSREMFLFRRLHPINNSQRIHDVQDDLCRTSKVGGLLLCDSSKESV